MIIHKIKTLSRALGPRKMSSTKLLCAAFSAIRQPYHVVLCNHCGNNQKQDGKLKINGFSNENFSTKIPHMKNAVVPPVLKSMYTNLLFRLGKDPRLPSEKRKKVVVLGTGWASLTFVKHIDITKYDVTIVSPKNYFSFTPLLPSVCAGVLSARSCAEPVRDHVKKGKTEVMQYYQACATKVDPIGKVIECRGSNGEAFKLNFDYLVCGVGSEVNSFGIPGVTENSLYLKDAHQADLIHSKLIECFEKAALPSAAEEDKKRLLSFVIVGGGPSGVETAAEICDFINEEAKHAYPQIAKYAQVTLIEMLPKLLPSFSQAVSDYTLKTLQKIECNVQLKSRVTRITPTSVCFVDENNKEHNVQCGFNLWASGIGQTPFGKHMLDICEFQKTNRILKIDESLKVWGMPNCYAFGDCAFYSPKYLANDVEAIFDHAKKGDKVSPRWLKTNATKLSKQYPQIASYDMTKLPDKPMSKLEFMNVLKDIDVAFRPPPPTAQTAAQEAHYLANIFNAYHPNLGSEQTPAWNYRWKGSMSYVGDGNSVIQTPYGTILGGYFSKLMWRAAYFNRLFSVSSQWACLSDWMRTAIFGRRKVSTLKSTPTTTQ